MNKSAITVVAVFIVLIIAIAFTIDREKAIDREKQVSRYFGDKLDSATQRIPVAKSEMAQKVIDVYERGGCVRVEQDHHVVASMSPTACLQKEPGAYPTWFHID